MNYDKKLSILDLPSSDNPLNSFYNKKYEWYDELWLEICAKYDHIIYSIRNIFIGVKNIIIYAPIIYNTREWDYDYLLDLIKFKLQRMSKDMTDSKIIKDYDKTALEMDKTISHIENYRNNVEIYELQHQDELTNIINEKDENKAEELTKDFIVNTYKFEEECWNNIWDNIKENGRGWWS